ncbi:hypothetical protein EUX98_g6634 [Antrodiella citrinella]|uniref:BTB domain-containing protein n=1 Tax=Antrodiella citrinella TaxID=2447956 RepID=A0A4S4MNI1_9APHY|nr:hypothetical protein EUX98_g6634 [Antrodiella citrinella]
MESYTQAQSPFDRADGDVVLLSSDQVKFSCHKITLSIASPFFSDMFSLKQRDDQKDDVITGDGTPVVPVTEDSTVLYNLLLLLYPLPQPKTLLSLNMAASLLEAGRKYDIAVVKERAKTNLMSNIQERPLKVFAIACGLDMDEEARAAAHHLLTMTIESRHQELRHVSVLENVSAGAYCRLLQYLRAEGKVPPDFCFTHHNVPATAKTAASTQVETLLVEYPSHKLSLWSNTDFFHRNPQDVLVRSEDSYMFPAHCLVLSLASTHFAEILESRTIPSQDGSPSIIDLPEKAVVVYDILRCCYGLPPSDDDDADDLFSLIRVAATYRMAHALELLRNLMRPLISSTPLRTYFVSAALGWDDEAQRAALCAAKSGSVYVYVPEMEIALTPVYYRLVQFRRKIFARSFEVATNDVMVRPRYLSTRIHKILAQQPAESSGGNISNWTKYYAARTELDNIMDGTLDSQLSQVRVGS